VRGKSEKFKAPSDNGATRKREKNSKLQTTTVSKEKVKN
jgi:hypothetical protein